MATYYFVSLCLVGLVLLESYLKARSRRAKKPKNKFRRLSF
jgi:hypothetical protein